MLGYRIVNGGKGGSRLWKMLSSGSSEKGKEPMEWIGYAGYSVEKEPRPHTR